MQSRDLATSLYKEGDLSGAIEAQIAWVRNQPADMGARLFLFELLSFDGQWERAERQGQALLTNDLESDAAIGFYLKCLQSETKRSLAYRGGAPPRVLGPLSTSMQLRLEALGKRDAAEASQLIAQAETLEAAADKPARLLNSMPVKHLRDGDDLLGPILEVFAQGEYFWIDINHVHLLETSPPKYARDLLWLPARLETESESGNVFLPMIYHESSANPDVALRLGRATDWAEEPVSHLSRGIGLKEWYLDGRDALPLLDWRTLAMADDPTGPAT